ncbi:hypothetical protein BGZ89_006736 [Linnemannia elongata]|nr:hypothetical protein BGZ89_006736 [Linnemannia elongata]
MEDEPKTQSFLYSTTGQSKNVLVHFHSETDQHIVFWKDILAAFPDIANPTIYNGRASIPFAEHYPFYHEIEPKCIVYQPNATLTITTEEVVETTVPEQMNFETQSVVSGFTANTGHQGPNGFLDVVDEDGESVQDIEIVNRGMERIEFGGDLLGFEYHQPSPGDPDSLTVAIPANISPFADNHNNGNVMDRSSTPPLSTTSSSESGTGSGVSTSSATNIPPSNIDTAGTTPVVPEPAEIDPVEATSSWASIFRTLGDLQEQYKLTPEETTKMFTEITQSA